MPRYVWEGRSRHGSQARGELQAASRDDALRQLRAGGITLTTLRESAGAAAEASPPVVPETGAPPRPGRRTTSLRDQVFYIGVAVASTAIGLGVAYVAPVLTYDCSRDAVGAVRCVVHRRMYGLIPIPDVRLERVVSADVEDYSTRGSMADRGRVQAGSKLVLACADRTRWKSTASAWPMGQSNDTLAGGIRDLLDGGAPREFHGWQGEKVALLAAAAFLLPAALILIALLVRIVVGRERVEARVAELEASALRRGRTP
jgi:hypothetical protein